MRDFKLITPTVPSAWNLDIDFIDGAPAYLDNSENTQDQRAAVAAYTVIGSIPGKPEEGVPWNLLLEKEATFMNVDNAIKKNIQDHASSIPDGAATGYIPHYVNTPTGIGIQVIKI